MAGSGKTRAVIIVAGAIITGVSLLMGTDELARYVVPALAGGVFGALSDSLRSHIIDALNEPGKNMVGKLADEVLAVIASKFTEPASTLDGQLRLAASSAMKTALQQLSKEFRQHPYYRSLARQNPPNTEPIDELFRTLIKATDEPEFLKEAIQDLQDASELRLLILGHSRQLDTLLQAELKQYTQLQNRQIIEFLQQRLVPTTVEHLLRLLNERTEEGSQAARSFLLLQVTCLATSIKGLEHGQGQLQYGQAVINERLASIDQKLNDLIQLISNQAVPISQLQADEVSHIVRQIAQGTLHRFTVYVSAGTNVEPYREKAIEYFTRANYHVLNTKPSDDLPQAQRLALIETCDLFVGIYAHEGGGLIWDTGQHEHPTSYIDLTYARRFFRRCLVLVADKQVSELTLPRPTPPIYRKEPENKSKQVPHPKQPKIARSGLHSWFVSQWARISHDKTPHELWDEYEQQLVRYQRQVAAFNRHYEQEKAEYKRATDQLDNQYRTALLLYQTRRDAQRQLLAIVNTHFVSYVFTTPESIAKAIREGLNALDHKHGFGLSTHDVFERWSAWASYQENELWEHVLRQGSWQSDLAPHPLSLASPVEGEVEPFLAYAWHEDVQPHIESVVAATRVLASYQQYFTQEIKKNLEHYLNPPSDRMSDDDPSLCTYPEFAARLQRWCGPVEVDKHTTEFKRQIKVDQRKHKDLHEELIGIITDWQEATRPLHRFLDNAPYGKCLLVTGRTGSGKTHLVGRLLHNHADSSSHLYCLYIPLESFAESTIGVPSIERLILDAASFAYQGQPAGPRWQSFAELAHFVAMQSGKLLIIIDDLEVWLQKHLLNLAELQVFIERHTHLRHVSWALCLSEANIHLIDSADDKQFWRRYGFGHRDIDAASPGWIGLDDRNIQSRSWERILTCALNGESNLSQLQQTLDQISQELLSIPFIAWLLGRLARTHEIPLEELRNLNYISFVRLFWERRLELSRAEPITADGIRSWNEGLWRMLYLAAGVSITHHKLMFTVAELLRLVVDADDHKTSGFDDQTVKSLLNGLIGMGVLRQPYAPEATAKEGSIVEFSVFPLWEWQSGEYAARQTVTSTHVGTITDSWPLTLLIAHHQTEPDHHIEYAQGVLEFLILALDTESGQTRQQRRRFSDDQVQHITRDIFDRLPSRWRYIWWLAASKASPSFQWHLAQWLVAQPPQSFSYGGALYLTHENGELQRYLLWLKYAHRSAPDGRFVAPYMRVKLLQPFFSQIAGDPLYGFLKSLIEYTPDPGEVARAFAYLHGIESVLGEQTYWKHADALAEWTYQGLRGRARQANSISINKLHAWMLHFLAEIASLAEVQPKDYTHHWLKMLRNYCDDLATIIDPENVQWLSQNAWFRWSPDTNSHRRLLGAVEEQFTLACGTWFRRGPNDEQKSHYVSAVDEIAKGLPEEQDMTDESTKGTPDHMQVAFFMIYHTVPAPPDNSEEYYNPDRVDEELWRIFLRIREEPCIRNWLKRPKFARWLLVQDKWHA